MEPASPPSSRNRGTSSSRMSSAATNRLECTARNNAANVPVTWNWSSSLCRMPRASAVMTAPGMLDRRAATTTAKFSRSSSVSPYGVSFPGASRMPVNPARVVPTAQPAAATRSAEIPESSASWRSSTTALTCLPKRVRFVITPRITHTAMTRPSSASASTRMWLSPGSTTARAGNRLGASGRKPSPQIPAVIPTVRTSTPRLATRDSAAEARRRASGRKTSRSSNRPITGEITARQSNADAQIGRCHSTTISRKM